MAAMVRTLEIAISKAAELSDAAQEQLGREMLERIDALAEGFERIEAFLTSLGRPLTALAACELRSPGQMSEDAFRRLNELYVERLTGWGLVVGGANPVAHLYSSDMQLLWGNLLFGCFLARYPHTLRRMLSRPINMQAGQ